MTTTREEQRDVVDHCADCGKPILANEPSYYSAARHGECFGRSFHSGCGDPFGTKALRDELTRLRASQAGGVPALRKALKAAFDELCSVREWAACERAALRPQEIASVSKVIDLISVTLSASPPPPATALAAWQDISTAPKDGTWVLCLAKRATVPVIASHQFSTGGIGLWIDKDASDFSGHDDPSEAWIEYWNSNSYTPTHWMPLPPLPDDRTNASEAQSGSLNQALPASPVSATDAVKAERACSAKDILLYLRAEASEWKEDVDGDANDSGRMISYVTHHITLADNNLQELLDMAGVKPVWSETCVDALDRINEAEFDAAAIRSRGTDEVGNG